jgi:hypothetical protein
MTQTNDNLSFDFGGAELLWYASNPAGFGGFLRGKLRLRTGETVRLFFDKPLGVVVRPQCGRVIESLQVRPVDSRQRRRYYYERALPGHECYSVLGSDSSPILEVCAPKQVNLGAGSESVKRLALPVDEALQAPSEPPAGNRQDAEPRDHRWGYRLTEDTSDQSEPMVSSPLRVDACPELSFADAGIHWCTGCVERGTARVLVEMWHTQLLRFTFHNVMLVVAGACANSGMSGLFVEHLREAWCKEYGVPVAEVARHKCYYFASAGMLRIVEVWASGLEYEEVRPIPPAV